MPLQDEKFGNAICKQLQIRTYSRIISFCVLSRVYSLYDEISSYKVTVVAQCGSKEALRLKQFLVTGSVRAGWIQCDMRDVRKEIRTFAAPLGSECPDYCDNTRNSAV